MRRAPVVLLTIGLAALLGSYVWYTQRVVDELDNEARRTAELFSRIYGVAASPGKSLDAGAMFDLLATMREFHIPTVVTDHDGKPADAANLPFSYTGIDDPKLAEYVKELDALNPPVG